MASVYSTRFVWGLLTNTSINWYQVPANKIAVVKEVTFINTSGAAISAYCQWHDAGGDKAWLGRSVPAGVSIELAVRGVFAAGEQLRPYALTTNVIRCMITGYLFDA